MNPDFKRGLKTGFIVYLIGIPTVIITHAVLGIDNGHAPPASFVVALALIILSIIRSVKSAFNIFSKKEKQRSRGELSIHIVFLALVIGYFSLALSMT
jgi:hypothetical protein